MTGLLALVADTLRVRFSRAVARQVTDFATVVALLALSAVAAHVAVTAARVTGLAAAAAAATGIASAETSPVSTAGASIAAAETASALGAVPSDMANLTALVALLTATRSAGSAETAATRLAGWAITRQMICSTAVVASLLLGWFSAVAREVALLSAVVARRGPFVWAVPRLVGGVAAIVAGATVACAEFHRALGREWE